MNPEESLFRREQAQDLFLYSGKTQKEIAVEVGVSDRTLYEWIKRYDWNAQKQRIHKPPLTLSEGIVLELTNLQTQILAKDSGVPSIDQANIMHKLVWCLFKLNTISKFDHTATPVIIEDEADDSLACPPLEGATGEDVISTISTSNPEFANQITPSPKEREPEGEAPSSASEFSPKPEEVLPLINEDQSINPLPTSSDMLPDSEVYGNNDVISTPTNSGERSLEQTKQLPLSAPQSPLSSEDPPLTYREKMWELAKKDAKEKGLWQPRSLPSNLLEPGTPEYEAREKKRKENIERIKESMKREQYNSGKRKNDW